MKITHLSKDSIDQIISTSHSYNIMFVNKHFKNMAYTDLIKCDVCGKNVKLKGVNLWNTDALKDGCHNTCNYMSTNYIDFYQFDNSLNTSKCFMSMCKKTNEFIVTITDKIKITPAINTTVMTLESRILDYNDVMFLQGEYIVTMKNDDLEELKKQKNTHMLNFVNGEVMLHFINNKYTKQNYKLQFITNNRYKGIADARETSRNRFQLFEKSEIELR